MSNWWKKGSKEIPFDNKNFQKILKFYLFECHSEHTFDNKKGKKREKYKPVSLRGKSLREMGWESSNATSLISNMKTTASRNLYYDYKESVEEFKENLKRIECDPQIADTNFDMIVFLNRNDMNKANAILYYIRNAFAHGSFTIDNGIYYFESSKNNNIKALIRLREQTLLNWIELINSKPEALKSRNAKKKNKKAA